MDQRQTFGTIEELRAILANLRLSQAKVSLLLDRDGLTRMEGIIAPSKENEHLSTVIIFIVHNMQETVSISEIIAVNGIFHSDYSEC